MADDLAKILDDFVGLAEGGGLFLPPPRNSLGDYSPPVAGLARDQGIVMQKQDDGTLDGGDSANRTGILAFCNSSQDKLLLPLFEDKKGVMVRHPTQPEWSKNPFDPDKGGSRDQLIGYVAGCWRTGHTDIAKRLLDAHIARGIPPRCQNGKDILMPHDVMYLNICAGNEGEANNLFAQLSLQAAIETLNPAIDAEHNQIILESIICGRLDLYVQTKPRYEENVRNYWSGWRNQPQIADALIEVIKQELKRYGRRPPLPLLFPRLPLHELYAIWDELEKLFSSDWRKELDKIVRHPDELVKRFVKAWAADVEDYLYASVRLGQMTGDELRRIAAQWGIPVPDGPITVPGLPWPIENFVRRQFGIEDAPPPPKKKRKNHFIRSLIGALSAGSFE